MFYFCVLKISQSDDHVVLWEARPEIFVDHQKVDIPDKLRLSVFEDAVTVWNTYLFNNTQLGVLWSMIRDHYLRWQMAIRNVIINSDFSGFTFYFHKF